uniref:Uncharacterized protein n=1 Tax=Arundo donax TaxID=35708 RepID=A0A0A9CH69_ARUDO
MGRLIVICMLSVSYSLPLFRREKEDSLLMISQVLY